eukprot:Nk52_evm4s242 gene=Nk52_evmTU4s242
MMGGKFLIVAAILASTFIFANCQDINLLNSYEEYAASPEWIEGSPSHVIDDDVAVFHSVHNEHETVSIHRRSVDEQFSLIDGAGKLFDRLKKTFKGREKEMDLVRNKRKLQRRNSNMPDSYWDFIPVFLGAPVPGSKANSVVSKEDNEYAAQNACFKHITMEAVKVDNEHVKIELHATDRNPNKKFVCQNYILVGTAYSFRLIYMFPLGNSWSSSMTLKAKNADEMLDMTTEGLRVYRSPHGVIKTIADIVQTAKLFVGALTGDSSVPERTAQNNIQFLKDYAGYEMKPRQGGAVSIDIPKEEIKSGTFVGIARLDGLDPMIMWGTGSRLGHTCVTLWIDDELYVVESQTESNYWPKNFIQRTKWEEWRENAKKADYNWVLFPLSEEKQAVFEKNAHLAVDYFKKVEGVLYGYQNLLWGWIDTPNQNLPHPLSNEFVMSAFAIVEPLSDALMKKSHTPSLWRETFNHMIGKEGLTTYQVYAQMEKEGLSFGEMISRPIKDSWGYRQWTSKNKYEDNQPAMVCDVFVCNVYKHAGLFGDLEVECGEFTPLDVYELNFYKSIDETKKQWKKYCRNEDVMCQLGGAYVVDLGEEWYNKQKPFSHMREHCPALAPYNDRLAARNHC